MVEAAFDLVVIGGGSAGLTAARFAAQLGARVALVERERLGGDCTWTGCIPSKALLRAAQAAHELRHADRFGLVPTETRVDLARVMARVRAASQRVAAFESAEALRRQGVQVLFGAARFVDPHLLDVAGREVRSERFVICTGAASVVPSIPDLAQTPHLTYEQVFDLATLPRRLLVLGAGATGVELSQAFQRLGAAVTLVEQAERILPGVDPEASAVLGEQLAEDGVALRLGAAVEMVRPREGGVVVRVAGEVLEAEALLVAAGRRPRVEGLGLDAAGVAYSQAGVAVDEHLCTSQRHIFAAGDVTGGFQLTHYAGWQGFLAARNALLPGASPGTRASVPWGVFTDPELAQAGLSEPEARAKHGQELVVSRWPVERIDRAQAAGEARGLLKVLHSRDGVILGATIVAARAGEMIHEYALALERGLKLDDLASVIHVYPSYSMATQQLAAEYKLATLLRGATGAVLKTVGRWLR